MAASAGGVPEQLEQVRVAQVTHPAASSSAHEIPDNRHGARRAAGPCEVEWRRARSSSATSPSRLGQSVLSVLHPRQFEGRCFAVRHPDPKCTHASAAPAASCARVSITHVVACLRPPVCVAVGRGTPKHLHSNAIDEKGDGNTPLHRACCFGHLAIATLLLDRGACSVDLKRCKADARYPQEVMDLLSAADSRRGDTQGHSRHEVRD